MKFEIILKTRSPNKARKFYSIIGIKWLGGEDLVGEIQESEDEMGLPDLLGEFGNIEISFYIDRSIEAQDRSSLVLVFYVDSFKILESIISKLIKENLYVKVESRKPFCEETLLDPDGHRIAICVASPFS